MIRSGLALWFVGAILMSSRLSAAGESTIFPGEADYLNHCAACHGVSGQGDGVVAGFLAIPAADLTLLAKSNSGKFPRDRAIMIVDGRQQVRAHATRNMPVWGDLFKYEEDGSNSGNSVSDATVRKRIETLVDYLQSIQQH
jgi:mono/diheme cytochrome c family protein